MDFLTMVILFVAGLSVREVWRVMVRWHSAGEAEEVILESEYQKRNANLKELVVIANTETHAWKAKADYWAREAQKLDLMNRDLKAVIRDADNELQLIRRAQ